jgi:hypothetical protein
LYGRKNDLTIAEKEEVEKHEAEVEKCTKHIKLRKDIISLLRLSDNRETNIQDYIQKIENKLTHEKIN